VIDAPCQGRNAEEAAARQRPLGNGIAWYAALRIGAALLTPITAAVGLTDQPRSTAATAFWLALHSELPFGENPLQSDVLVLQLPQACHDVGL
jgi:hypothetical protein